MLRTSSRFWVAELVVDKPFVIALVAVGGLLVVVSGFWGFKLVVDKPFVIIVVAVEGLLVVIMRVFLCFLVSVKEIETIRNYYILQLIDLYYYHLISLKKVTFTWFIVKKMVCDFLIFEWW